MEQCEVMFSGEKYVCDIFKENTHTVWVYTPEVPKRTRVRKRRPTSDDLHGDWESFLDSEPMYNLMLPSISEEIEIENTKIVKRHKRKHQFKKLK